MVRLDKCVEALYDGATMDDKQKTLHILKVMKGAISMSKSKTGECIFRSNKVETVNLDRLVKGHKKNSLYEVSRIDTNKKMVVNRWSKLLEHQTICSAETLFSEIIDVESPMSMFGERSRLTPSPVRVTQEKDSRLRRLLDLRLSRYDSHPKIVIRKRRRHEFSSRPPTPESDSEESPNENADAKFVTEKPEIRDKYHKETEPKHSEQSKNKTDGSPLKQTSTLLLPNISEHQGFKFKSQHSSSEEKQAPAEIEKDLTDWRNWDLKDKTWINRYISKEKTRQEDLLLRNALNNIEKEMSGANTIKRHQIRQKLQIEKEREAIERKKAEALLRQYTCTSPEVTINTPSDSHPVLPSPVDMRSPLPEIKNDRSPRIVPIKGKNNLLYAKKSALSEAMNSIDKNVNGLPVIVEHPVITRKNGKSQLLQHLDL